MSDGPQKIYGLAGATLGACVLFTSPCLHLRILILLFSIVEAIATLTVGLTIGLIFIWKVGLVGLGETSYAYQDGVVIDADCLT